MPQQLMLRLQWHNWSPPPFQYWQAPLKPLRVLNDTTSAADLGVEARSVDVVPHQKMADDAAIATALADMIVTEIAIVTVTARTAEVNHGIEVRAEVEVAPAVEVETQLNVPAAAIGKVVANATESVPQAGAGVVVGNEVVVGIVLVTVDEIEITAVMTPEADIGTIARTEAAIGTGIAAGIAGTGTGTVTEAESEAVTETVIVIVIEAETKDVVGTATEAVTVNEIKTLVETRTAKRMIAMGPTRQHQLKPMFRRLLLLQQSIHRPASQLKTNPTLRNKPFADRSCLYTRSYKL